MSWWKPYAIAFVAFFLVMAGLYVELMLWDECRQTNSFFYCLRVLGQ